MLSNDILVLGLMNLPKLGRSTVNKIVTSTNWESLQTCNDIQNVLRYFKFSFSTYEIEKAFLEAEETLKEQEFIYGINAITVLDSNFPRRLRNIPNPPPIIFYKGNFECLIKDKLVAVIGTREPSKHGIAVAEKVSRIFTELGFGIVSGLATGIDTSAHIGCLKGSGKTIAVMGTSLDKVYPSENRRLARHILENQGCWISEYPIGVSVGRSAFVERDRIQSALSAAVVVIETDIEGGTMHTVDAAAKQRKLIICYKPTTEFWGNPKVQGNLKLLNENIAIPLSGKEDIEPVVSRIYEYLLHEKFSRNSGLSEQLRMF